MVMITLDIPKDVNKEIEHFKIEHELKDKREAIVLLLKRCIPRETVTFEEVYEEADKTTRHNLTPKQIEAMDSDVYE